MKATFTTAVLQEEGMNATGLQVPADVVTTLNSGKRPKVKVSLNGYTYRSTVALLKSLPRYRARGAPN